MSADFRGSPTAEPAALHERASATPLAHGYTSGVTRSPASWARRPAAPIGKKSLREQQTWFAEAITTPEDEAPVGAAEVEERLTAGPQAGPLERLEVYRRAYHARLTECLLDDYPAVGAALGADAFEGLCRRYIASFPPRGSNLNAYGRHFSTFCRDDPATLAATVPRTFLAELAALEWALVEVIHAESSEPLTVSGLSDLPVDRWANARLVATPASRLLFSTHPVNAYFQSFRLGESPSIPEPAAAAVVVYRSGPTLWRMNLTEPMAALLSALRRGETLGEAIELAATHLATEAEEVVAGRVMVWFREWVASGLFARLEL